MTEPDSEPPIRRGFQILDITLAEYPCSVFFHGLDVIFARGETVMWSAVEDPETWDEEPKP